MRLRFPQHSLLLLLVLIVLVVPQAALADAHDVDWKYFGGAEPDGKTVRMFYDAKGIVRSPNGHIEVWTKGILESEIDRVLNAKPDQASIDRVAKKVGQAHYVPPVGATAELTREQALEITMDEDVADNAIIQPTARILFELDCAGRLDRMLSVSIFSAGKPGFSNKPGEWEHVAPETNVAALLKILCSTNLATNRQQE